MVAEQLEQVPKYEPLFMAREPPFTIREARLHRARAAQNHQQDQEPLKAIERNALTRGSISPEQIDPHIGTVFAILSLHDRRRR